MNSITSKLVYNVCTHCISNILQTCILRDMRKVRGNKGVIRW